MTPQQESKPEGPGISPETRWRKKPVVIEAITFEELVAHGLRQGVPAYNGLPWSFDYKGHPITHESDDCFLIPTAEGVMKFWRGEMLITGVKGEIYPCKPDIFAATYELAETAPPQLARESAPSRRMDRLHVWPDEIDAVFADMREQLERRIVKHGRGAYINPHELLGVMAEEYHELVEAVRSNNLTDFEAEMIDVAITALFGLASKRAWIR